MNQFGQVTIYKQSNPEEVIERIQEADIIITNKCLLTEEVLQYASKVKLICITATGVNNVDLDYCHRRGITVCNVAGYSSLSVAQHTFAFALALLHKNSYYHTYHSLHNQKHISVHRLLHKTDKSKATKNSCS